MFREVQNVLTRCVLPDMDVLLPRMAQRKSGDIFFVVACADQTGTEILVRRIRGQLALCKNLQNASLDYAVSFTMIGIPSKKDDIPFGHLVEGIVGKIESLIRSVTETHDRIPPEERNLEN